MQIRALKKVIVFLRTTWLIIYMFHSSECIVHTLCKATIHIVCYYGEIEEGPDSIQIPISVLCKTVKHKSTFV